MYLSVHFRNVSDIEFHCNNLLNKQIPMIVKSGISLALRKAEEVGKELFKR